MLETEEMENWGAADKSGERLVLDCYKIFDSDGSETVSTLSDTKSICRFASDGCEKDGEVPRSTKILPDEMRHVQYVWGVASPNLYSIMNQPKVLSDTESELDMSCF